MKRTTDEELAEFAVVNPQAPKSAMINRIADLIVALKAERRARDVAEYKLGYYERRFPCDGGCVDEPEETCARDGRTPRDLWNLIDTERREKQELALHQPSIWYRTKSPNPFLRCGECGENYPCTTVRRAAGELF